MSYEDWIMAGSALLTQDDTVYLKAHGTLDPFRWGGRCMRAEESTEALGDVTITQRRNPRGGLERDSVIRGAPGETTFTLAMKKLQADRKATDLKDCAWNVDQRTMCEGIDADSPFTWDQIKRHCHTTFTNRVSSGSSYDGDNEEAMVSFDATALYTEDIYRVDGEGGSPLAGMTVPIAVMFTDVATCQPARCPSRCDTETECVVVAVTEDDLTNPYLAVSIYGGDLDTWTDAPIALTDFGAFGADSVACLGEFVVVVSAGATSIIYSDDRGTTQVNVTHADMAANAPARVDMIDQSFIIVTGANGYIYGSYDAARTWEVLDAGNATALALGRVMIARDNPQVIYAVSSADDIIIKSENGGRTWFATATTTSACTAITGLWVVNQSTVILGTDIGEVYETVDGGATWTEQNDLPVLTAATKANTSIADITGCGCGDLFLITENSADDTRHILRSVDGGADGRWFEPDDIEDVLTGVSLAGIACCGPNHAIAVGGITVTSDLVMLIR